MLLLSSITSSSTEATSSSSGSTSGGGLEQLKGIFTNPVLYIVLGCLVAAGIAFYLYRRMIKATPNAVTIVVRGGKIYKVLDENNPKYFLVPFRDSVGAVITFQDKNFTSDKLFINNGPDALYRINYTLTYKVNDPRGFYPYLNNIQDLMIGKINDSLRLYADEGNALTIVKGYRENEATILSLINEAVKEYHVEATGFKVNLIEPMGKN